MSKPEYPIHRFFHTFLGGTLAGAASGLVLVGVIRLVGAYSPALDSFVTGLRPTLRSEISSAGLMAGAILGGLTHPLLDGMMHADVRPFSPWSQANPMLRFIGMVELHFVCLVLGVVGLAIVVLRLYLESRAIGARRR